MFVLHPAGIGLLLKGAAGKTALAVTTAALGVAALASDVQNWPRSVLLPLERAALISGGIPLAYPGRWSDAAGLALVTIVGATHWFRTRTPRTA